ncbi:hypothetical protein BLNAU_22054 [Blattamonas nauphoetae]|uniref:Protein kinase domain-containing protein n=1 Tax=Blattamonas nauphoetae TaxID=2049346 RepID=A0ABQ9WU48_9EUKA|nr:hypothetical protein BLNAU_22054 [Blattamonas nauphoetae]
MECSPLIVCGDIAGHGSQIQIIRSTHISQSNVVLPLVGTCRNASGIDIGTQVMTDQTTNSDSHDKVSISGVGLLMTNQHFALGTGPLFTFHTGAVLENGMSVETSMLESTLVNVSSSSAFSPSEHLFGSEVSQRVVGSCVEKCTNHDSGTGMMSPNMGGTLMCLNTTFSSCIRERNTELEFSFENRTNTSTPARLIVSTADVTSVSFTLCTFSEMTVADESGQGGSAIIIFDTNSALTNKACFFLKCSGEGSGNSGGAMNFNPASSTESPFTVTDSSFAECSTSATAGSLLISSASSRLREMLFDGSRWHPVPFSGVNTVPLLPPVQRMRLYKLGNHKRLVPSLFSSTTTSDMVAFCDSTSGAPNYKSEGSVQPGLDLIPQVTATVSVQSACVAYVGNQATVTVSTRTAINGTMRVLLEGSNVPRLVHVVFGDDSTTSKTGTATVSSGANGILPDADYFFRKAALKGAAVLPPPMVRSAVSTLHDWNTTEIVLSGANLEEGSFWMLVEKDGNEWNISLTHSGSETLIGRAPLHTSTVPDRLEWSTEYEVIQVMWTPEGEQTEIEVRRSHTITFTTPDGPQLITACTNRQLSKALDRMIVFLEGRALLSRTGKVSLTDEITTWESLSNVVIVDDTHCTAEFAVGNNEMTGQLKYKNSYTLKGSWTKTDGFVVNDGITIVVPHPPAITHLTFPFSNTLHSGCFVTLTGTDLIVGNSLNVTLNNSLSFIATVTSETEAKSAEVQIGWPSTLQHNTKYEITSVKATNEAFASPTFDPAITDTAGSPVDPFIIYSDSGSSSDSSLFCGDLNRPCSSIEVGRKIMEGMGVHQTTMKIIESSTLSSSISISSNKRVMITKSTDIEPTLRIPSSSSSMSGGEGGEDVVLIEVEDSFLEMESLNVVVEWSDLSLSLIAASRSTVVLLSVSIAGQKERRLWNSIDLDGGLCGWESGFLKLVNSTTTITSTQLSHLWQGAINIEGGDLTIDTSTFRDNTPHSSSFPSLRHNIHCSKGGEIEIGSLSGGDGSSDTHPHLWLLSSDCELSGDDVNVNAPFFIPTLSSSSTSKLNKTEKAFCLSIEGKMLILCSLVLEVFEVTKDGKDGVSVPHPLSEETAPLFNETVIELSLPLSALSSLDESLEWRGRLGFGKDQKTATSFLIQKNARERRSEAVKENMKWWLPLVIVVCVVIVIVMVVVLVCWRHRRNEKHGTNVEEMKGIDQPSIEEEKLEIVTDNRIGVISTQACASSKSQADTKMDDAAESSMNLVDFENLEEALPCCGEMKTTVYVSKDRTLYNALHSEKRREVRVRQAQIQLVQGLKGVLKKDRDAAILRALTAHNILFDSKQNVCLKLNLDALPHTHLPISTQQRADEHHSQQERPDPEPTVETNESKQIGAVPTERVNEGVRWYAPEVISNKADVNSGHGAVFSLGLILWEMETGSVPFGEQDAVNASRQIVTGVVPKLELVENAEMRELISQCLCLGGDGRPDLDTIEATLAQIPADTSIHPKAFVES